MAESRARTITRIVFLVGLSAGLAAMAGVMGVTFARLMRWDYAPSYLIFAWWITCALGGSYCAWPKELIQSVFSKDASHED